MFNPNTYRFKDYILYLRSRLKEILGSEDKAKEWILNNKTKIAESYPPENLFALIDVFCDDAKKEV